MNPRRRRGVSSLVSGGREDIHDSTRRLALELSPAEGRSKSAVAGCTAPKVVWSTVASREAHRLFIQPESTRRFHNGTHEGYICLPARHLDHDLSGIYHNELQDDKVPVSVHESPPARMSQTAPLLRRRICSLGTRHFCAARRTACLLGVISNTT
jgi:hypothetical protein